MLNREKYLLNACAVGICLVSCGRGIVNDAPVKLVHPKKELSLAADLTLNSNFEECQQIYQMNIVSDSILVCGEQGTHEGDFFFKAYSCNTLQYLGAFIRKGRADGEFLHPRIVSMNNSDRDLFIRDMSLNVNVAVNVPASVDQAYPFMRFYPAFAESEWAWFPLSDSLFFEEVQNQNDEFVYKVTDSKEKEVKVFNPFEGINCLANATYLSEQLLCNHKCRKVVQVMFFFPQMNIFDLDKGSISSYAVDKRYRQWKSVLNRNMNKNTMSYYNGATASDDYIFMSYSPMTLSQKVSQEPHVTSIQIFDWDGHWLYDIKVNESIEAMAYDGVHKFLYAVDKAEGQIVRYNLGDIL